SVRKWLHRQLAVSHPGRIQSAEGASRSVRRRTDRSAEQFRDIDLLRQAQAISPASLAGQRTSWRAERIRRRGTKKRANAEIGRATCREREASSKGAGSCR